MLFYIFNVIGSICLIFGIFNVYLSILAKDTWFLQRSSALAVFGTCVLNVYSIFNPIILFGWLFGALVLHYLVPNPVI